ncbi:MAG: MOSC domain-containing protein [Granulosicoccus sp.]|nr:MOSC domain-containing protein [Granulosicoccus sp.]
MGSMTVIELFKHPVKGFTAESCSSLHLQTGEAIAGDRALAITHGRSAFDRNTQAWAPRRNFLVVAHSPELSAIRCAYDDNSEVLTLSKDDRFLFDQNVSNPGVEEALNAALKHFGPISQPGPYALVRALDAPFTDSPTKTVSLMNSQSARQLEMFVGIPLSKRRFRGNVWFEGTRPFEERDWIGQEMQLGKARIRIVENIDRCAALDVEPGLGERNHPVLKTLNQQLGHNQFGVLAEVLSDGEVSVGDTLRRMS